MILHLFRLVWNRRRANALVMIEILVCFLALCVVLTSAVRFSSRWNEPIGFKYKDVWQVQPRMGAFTQSSEEQRLVMKQSLAQLESGTSQHPEVETVALCANAPFSNNSDSQTIFIDGKRHGLLVTKSSLSLKALLELELVDGRWIEDADEALAWTPMVIAEKTAESLFPDSNPLGERFPSFNREGQRVDYDDLEPEDRGKDYRVVGIMKNIRRNGEVGTPVHVAFVPADLKSAHSYPPTNLLIKVRPGTTAQFEVKLLKSLHALQPEWSFQVSTLEQRRRSVLRIHLLPLAIGSVVATALISMVGMGLVGVLWQNVGRRTSELGLRRALGATARQVQFQIMGELGALATISLLIGTIIFLQAPFLFPDLKLSWNECLLGLALSALVTGIFVSACSFYPSWLASRIQPSQALQYE